MENHSAYAWLAVSPFRLLEKKILIVLSFLRYASPNLFIFDKIRLKSKPGQNLKINVPHPIGRGTFILAEHTGLKPWIPLPNLPCNKLVSMAGLIAQYN